MKTAARSGRPLHVWIPEELRGAIDAAAAQNRRPLRTEVEIALERYLAEIGLWPPDKRRTQPPSSH